MSNSICPSCDALISSENINVTEGVALCNACGKLTRLSEIIEHEAVSELLENAPAGCLIEERGEFVVIRASMRRWMSVVPILAFGTFWNGIVSVFIMQVIAGFYNAIGQPYPSWFPSMATSNAPTNWQDAIMLTLFMVPFVIIGIGFILAVLVQLTGQLDVRIHGCESFVRTSVAFVGWTKRFDANQVRHINALIGQPIQATNYQWIRIDADRTVRFGMLLPGDRKVWLAAVLRKLLILPKT